MDSKIISLRLPPLILAGIGALDRLSDLARDMKARKALLVTDRGVVESGTGDKVKSLLEQEGIAVDVFDKVDPDPGGRCFVRAFRGIP